MNLSIASEFTAFVRAHLYSKKPLSVIRYGDGESMMFGDSIENTHFILKKVLGYVPSENEIAAMTITLMEASWDRDWETSYFLHLHIL